VCSALGAMEIMPAEESEPSSLEPLRTAAPPEPEVKRIGFEERVGKQWATWLGALALLAAGGYYFQLAAGRGHLGARGKLGIAVAIALLAALVGDRLIRREARLLGQALLGVGIGLGFGAVYAGFAAYGLYGAHSGAAVMVAITDAGMTMAVRRDAPLIALLSVVAG
jgi:uncharacterized membrane protein